MQVCLAEVNGTIHNSEELDDNRTEYFSIFLSEAFSPHFEQKCPEVSFDGGGDWYVVSN